VLITVDLLRNCYNSHRWTKCSVEGELDTYKSRWRSVMLAFPVRVFNSSIEPTHTT